MPGRILPLVTSEFYHVYNRGIDSRPTFTDKKELLRAEESIKFYRFSSPPMRLSYFLSLGVDRRDQLYKELTKTSLLIEIISYCLMPNHFHFLLRQENDKGIAKFMSNFQNSYTRYFNTKNQRDGPLFLDQFKATRIETEEQLLHLSRYIHLNPYSSFVVKTLSVLENYSWSSLPDFLGRREGFCRKDLILSFFKKTEDYKNFVFDQADYQRKLESVKHLTFES